MNPLLSCQGLTCRLGKQWVLQGADFDVSTGEAVALLGSSGSGKSTLLRVIAGLEKLNTGKVLIEGELVSEGRRLLIPPHRRGIAMLFQDLALWPNLTVTGNVRLGLSGLRLSRTQSQNRIDHSLELCGIGELASRRPGTLSGGQQQRVALARSLAMEPQLLLLDEPLGGLDLLTKQTILSEIAQLKEKLGFTIVLVTHDPLEVQALCNSLAVLEHGRIAEHGSLKELTSNAKTELGRAFMHAMHGN